MEPSRQPPAVPRGGQVPVPRVRDPTALREWVRVPDGDVNPWDSLGGWRDYQCPGKFPLCPYHPKPGLRPHSFCPHRLRAEAFARPAEGPGDSFS